MFFYSHCHRFYCTVVISILFYVLVCTCMNDFVVFTSYILIFFYCRGHPSSHIAKDIIIGCIFYFYSMSSMHEEDDYSVSKPIEHVVILNQLSLTLQMRDLLVMRGEKIAQKLGTILFN